MHRPTTNNPPSPPDPARLLSSTLVGKERMVENGLFNGGNGVSDSNILLQEQYMRSKIYPLDRSVTVSRSSSQHSGLQRRSSSVSTGNSRPSSHQLAPAASSSRILGSPSNRFRISLVIGLALLVFIQVRQISNASSLVGHGQGIVSGGASRDLLMNLPRALRRQPFSPRNNNAQNSIKREGKFISRNNNGQNNIVSIREERKRVQSLSNNRAQRRRMRTQPPSTHPIDPPPHLTLDLPAHRALMDQRTTPTQSNNSNIWKHVFGMFANTNIINSIRGRLRNEQPPSTICGSHAREASKRHPNHYPASAHIGPNSRIVVTGALSQVGMELILQLHEHCKVDFIVGIDAAYPNTRHDRIDMIETRYKYIERRVPGFQRLIVPMFGVHPHPKMGGEARLDSMGEGFDLVGRFEPTHVVHLAGMEDGRGEHVDYGDTVDASKVAKERNGSLMRRFSSLLSMDQVLSSLARVNMESSGEEPRLQPQLVYVTSNEAGDQSGVSLKSGAAMPTPASVYGTTCLLNEVLANYYHRHHGVDSVGLRVPTVLGPFSRPGSLLYDLAEHTVLNAAGKNAEGVPKYHLDRDRYELSSMWTRREGAMSGAVEQMVYVSDVAQAIVAAMQFKKDYSSASIVPDGPTLMRIGSNSTTSMQDLKVMMEGYLSPADKWEATPASFLGETHESTVFLNIPGLSIHDNERNRDLLGWTHTTGLREGTQSMLAWQILKAHPFGIPVTVPSYSSFQSLLEDSRDSLPYQSLPCASGCGWGGSMCSTSVWDAVVDTTKEITKSCPYVLYTVDLRPELVRMEKQSAPSQRRGWEDLFCKIAFVSSSSELAKTIYTNDLNETTPMNVWNGKGKDGHWIIVALPGTQYTMPEFERSLAKLSPTNLFNDGVEKAIYVNHRRVTLATDQALGGITHMEMNARTTPGRKTIVDKKTKEKVVIYIPPRQHRRSVFFTNKLSFPDDYDTSSARAFGNFVMANAGIAETNDILAQIHFYEQTIHLTRTNTQRSDNYQEFFQDNFFPFDFLSTMWLAHDLKSEEGRNLRCEMYAEHSLWGNSKMEDLSIGFVLARRKVKMQLGKMAEHQYENNEEWYPLLTPREPGDDDAITEGPVYMDYLESAQKVATDSGGAEFYITFLPQQRKK